MAKKKKMEQEIELTQEEKIIRKLTKKLTDTNQRGQAEAIIWAVQYLSTGVDPEGEEDQDDEQE